MKYQIFKRYEDIAVYNEQQVIAIIGQTAYDACELPEEVMSKLAAALYSKDLFETKYEHIQTGDEMETAILNDDLTVFDS